MLDLCTISQVNAALPDGLRERLDARASVRLSKGNGPSKSPEWPDTYRPTPEIQR